MYYYTPSADLTVLPDIERYGATPDHAMQVPAIFAATRTLD